MHLTPVSYAGLTLNDSNLLTVFSGDGHLNQSPVTLRHSARAVADPLFSGRVVQPKKLTLMIQMKGTNHYSQVDTLNKYFALRMTAEATLIAQDEDDSDRQWYLKAVPAAQPKIVGALYTVQLVAAYGIWRTVTADADTSWSLTASAQTHDITTNPYGNATALPVITMKPTSAKTGAGIERWDYRRFVIAYSALDSTLTDSFQLATGGLDTAALVTAGKMQADGDDLRVIIDGIERDRWFYAINTSATKVWVNLTFQPRAEPTIKTAIAGAGAVTTIDFNGGKTNKEKFRKLPRKGRLLIDSEIFTYTDKDEAALTVTGATRAMYNTSAAAHSANATARWIEHEIWLVYGDASLAAPTQDNTLQPMFDVTSSNASHVYQVMSSNDGRRMSSWVGSVSGNRGLDTGVYTGNHEADADPATEMGMTLESWLSGKRYQEESASVIWQLKVPQGATHYAYTSEKYRKTTVWPKTVALQYSVDGKKWTTADSIATPADDTWTDDDQASTAFAATAYFVRFIMKGGVSAGEDYRASLEIDDVTLTIAAGGTPTFSVGSEIANYDLNVKVENTVNGSYFKLRTQVNLNQTFEIDCARKICTNKENSVRGPIVERPDGQDEWLYLTPGVTNTIKVTEPGLTGMDVDFSFESRNL